MCVNVCLSLCLCIMCMQCPWRPEEGIRLLRLELTEVRSHESAGT